MQSILVFGSGVWGSETKDFSRSSIGEEQSVSSDSPAGTRVPEKINSPRLIMRHAKAVSEYRIGSPAIFASFPFHHHIMNVTLETFSDFLMAKPPVGSQAYNELSPISGDPSQFRLRVIYFRGCSDEAVASFGSNHWCRSRAADNVGW